MADYPTPHINATPDDFGKVVLMPGDPLRSEFIAKTYLDGARLVNNVRGVQGYTGKWKGKTVSVMASGMGMPSIGIYSYELFRFFGVEAILRVGSAGALQPNVRTRDLVLGMGASANSSYADQYRLGGTFAPLCDFGLLEIAASVCREKGSRFHAGNLMSTDHFYNDDPEANRRYADMGILAVEMEAAALYLNAARLGKKALAICTVSDHIMTGENLSAAERQTGFGEMAEIALDTAARFLGDVL
ncbi:MAG: purine-nucleoside phosphorylase [Clostridia bacterium]|nr:purine-nucleoside phosphorylase [Clostridia bacterium]